MFTDEQYNQLKSGLNSNGMKMSRVELTKLLLSFLQELDESRRLVALQSFHMGNKSLLYYISEDPKSLIEIISLVPRTQIYAAINETVKGGVSVLRYISERPELLKKTLLLLPEEQRLYAAASSDESKWSLFAFNFNRPGLLAEIVSSTPNMQMIDALKLDYKDGKKLFQCMYTMPELIKPILSYIPEKDRLTAFQMKGSDNKVLFSYIYESPHIIKEIFSLLPVNDRLAALKVTDEHGKTLFNYIYEKYKDKGLGIMEDILLLLPENDMLNAHTMSYLHGDGLSIYIGATSISTKDSSGKESLPKGMRLGEALADGDCLFHSISLLTEKKFNSRQLRQKAVDYLRTNSAEYVPNIIGEEAFEKRIQEMEGTYEYADDFEIAALSFALEIQIVVISNNIPMPIIGPTGSPIIYLKHSHSTDNQTGVQGGHYEPIYLAKDADLNAITQELERRRQLAMHPGEKNEANNLYTFFQPGADMSQVFNYSSPSLG